MRSNLLSAAALTLLSGALLLGCGSTQTETPVGCLDGAASFASSLRQAPGEVLLGGKTAISDCLVRNQKDGDLVNFGEIAVEVATDTSAQIYDPGPDGINAAIDAGFLVGAMEKGSKDSDGIHATLVERVRAAASNGLNGASKTKQGHYDAGYEAGLDVG